MKPRMFLTIMGLVLVLFCFSSAQVPQLINYQGKLTKPTGAPLDTTIQMVFTIYADSNGVTSLWTETQTAVAVQKGVFNVLLGSVVPVSYSTFDGTTRYLGVKVGGDPEITPRKPMVSVPSSDSSTREPSSHMLNVSRARRPLSCCSTSAHRQSVG